MTNLLGIHGWARSGKDTAAGFLVDVGWEQRGFADPLRELAKLSNPIIAAFPGQVYDDGDQDDVGYLTYQQMLDVYGYDESKDREDEFRAYLQRLGNGARTVFGDDFWVQQAIRDITPESKIVWADVRYDNEALAVKGAGGIVIEIVRDGTGPTNEFEAKHHKVSTELIDYMFDNNGTLDALRDRIRQFVETV